MRTKQNKVGMEGGKRQTSLFVCKVSMINRDLNVTAVAFNSLSLRLHIEK